MEGLGAPSARHSLTFKVGQCAQSRVRDGVTFVTPLSNGLLCQVLLSECKGRQFHAVTAECTLTDLSSQRDAFAARDTPESQHRGASRPPPPVVLIPILRVKSCLRPRASRGHGAGRSSRKAGGSGSGGVWCAPPETVCFQGQNGNRAALPCPPLELSGPLWPVSKALREERQGLA